MSSEFSPFGNGETVGASDDSEPNTTAKTSVFPREVDARELTNLQAQVIQTAVLNRDLSTSEVAELVDSRGGHVAAVLRRHCPKWYYSEFGPNSNWVWGREVNCE